MTGVVERVAKGAQFLDQVDPDWWRENVERAIDLAPGEIVYSQTNCMCWMNDAIEMNTNTGGGFLAGVGRMFGGGSLFITDFTETVRDQDAVLAVLGAEQIAQHRRGGDCAKAEAIDRFERDAAVGGGRPHVDTQPGGRMGG